MTQIVQIGRCSACLRRARLLPKHCSTCLIKLGSKGCALVALLQQNPTFAWTCYQRLSGHRRAQFESILGAAYVRELKETMRPLTVCTVESS